MWNMRNVLIILVENKKEETVRTERRFENNINRILKKTRIKIYSCKQSNAFTSTWVIKFFYKAQIRKFQILGINFAVALPSGTSDPPQILTFTTG
jgi:hypothetical protein